MRFSCHCGVLGMLEKDISTRDVVVVVVEHIVGTGRHFNLKWNFLEASLVKLSTCCGLCGLTIIQACLSSADPSRDVLVVEHCSALQLLNLSAD